ncbi:MAG: hypothetical protein C4524_12875 [Candidatus Zixiibacteriota bacterium]|nr:MAG: hypothetical protein C4524_12875 [candidate division Zixibacteria bacterium]
MGAIMYLRAFLIWVLLALAMIANGIFREAVFTPAVGDHTAHALSSLTGLALILLVTRPFIRRLPSSTAGQLWGLGFFWLGLTLAFEFLFGHYVMGNPWSVLLADYNLLRGRLWVLVLAVIFLTPWIWGGRRLRG